MNYMQSFQYPNMGNSYQHFQQNFQQSNICKVVDGIEMVRAADVPMDGRTYFFPKADNSEIYGKKWNANGTTSVCVYKPLDDKTNTLSDSVVKTDSNALQNAVDGIYATLNAILEKIGGKDNEHKSDDANKYA